MQLSNKITKSKIVLSLKDSSRKPLREQPFYCHKMKQISHFLLCVNGPQLMAIMEIVRSYEHLAIGSFNVLMSFEFDFTYIDGQHGRNQQHVFVRICEYDDERGFQRRTKRGAQHRKMTAETCAKQRRCPT